MCGEFKSVFYFQPFKWLVGTRFKISETNREILCKNDMIDLKFIGQMTVPKLITHFVFPNGTISITGNENIARMLIESGADINIIDRYNNISALILAITSGIY